MKQKRAKIGFTGCAKAYIRSLQEEERYSTAHVYKNAVLSFTLYLQSWCGSWYRPFYPPIVS